MNQKLLGKVKDAKLLREGRGKFNGLAIIFETNETITK